MELLDFSSVTAREEYESFIQNHELGSFMQSLAWCDVKNSWKHEVIIIRNSQHKIIASMLVLIKVLPVLWYSFLYSPRGPVGDLQDKAVLAELLEGLNVLARCYHAYLFKCDPCVLSSDEASLQTLQDMGLILQNLEEKTIQCRCNYMLDIKNKTAEEVFQSFHSKWRYNIRLAERKGVVCKYFDKNTVQDKMDEFYPLMLQTGKRDGFYIRSKEYFTSLLNNLDSHCRLYLCYYQDCPVSGAIATQYAGKTCYVYGASSNTARNVMPNYLMQWHMIQWAVEDGDWIYDFQGIPYYYDEAHPNYGVYRFKQGFNGHIVEYAGEFDYLLSPWRKKLADRLYQRSKVIEYRKEQLRSVLIR